jgi:DNA-binding transcriptional regulator YhcF (GntR family)
MLLVDVIDKIAARYPEVDARGYIRRMRDSGAIIDIDKSPMGLTIGLSVANVDSDSDSVADSESDEISDDEITGLIAEYAHRSMTVEQIRDLLKSYDPACLHETGDQIRAVMDAIEQLNFCE